MDWEAEGLLEGLDAAAREDRRALLDELYDAGVPLEELRRAAREDRLVLLPVERLLTTEPRYTAREVAAMTGLDLDHLQASRRALGLPVGDPDERTLSEEELAAAWTGRRYRDAGFPDEEALEVTRVLGQGMARYAEATRTLVAETFLAPGISERELAHRYAAVAEELLPLAGAWMQTILALHLRQVLRQDALTREELITGRVVGAHEMAVAFADLVGFTELGEMVPLEELGGVAGRLARLAGEVVEPPVRVVKQIGDAVMLVAPEPAPLVEVGLRLVESAAGEDGTPPLRAGVAYGPAVARWGDFFGSPVNLAARLTARARPSSVLAAESVREAVGDEYAWSFAGEKALKGFAQPVKAFRVRRQA